jgi:pyruvate dehydrogenase (quinone)
MEITVADQLVETLIAAGVKRVYGIVGDSLNAVTEAIRLRQDEIQWVQVRHEEVAAFAAGAEAALTESLVVCAGSCGPGNLHLINGLFDCHRSRVPVLAIAAHLPSKEIGSSYFQATHPENLFLECSHYCELISTAAQMPRVVEEAIQASLTLRGVSVVVLPGDVAFQKMEKTIPRLPALEAFSYLRPTEENLDRAAKILDSAKKVTILGGAGCANAHRELVAVAEKLQAPIVHALRGKEFIEYDNRYDVGMTGLLGFRAGFDAMKDCDVLLMLGTDFPYEQFYPEKAKIIQVDIRGENIGRRARVEMGLVGGVKETLKGLLNRLKANKDSNHLETARKNYQISLKEMNDLAQEGSAEKPIHPQFAARLINELAAQDAIFTCDVGTPTVWAARYLRMNGQRRLLGSFNHASMAGAMPQAIGAQLTFPRRQVVALCGDGGFSMLMGDLLTIRQLKLPVKLIIFNNSKLSFVDQEMKAAGLLSFGVHLDNPNFAKMAESMGIHGIRIEEPEKVQSQLTEAFSATGPVLIDLVVNPVELAMPPHIDQEQAKGFGLFMLKAVLNGRSDEVTEIIKTNLVR